MKKIVLLISSLLLVFSCTKEIPSFTYKDISGNPSSLTVIGSKSFDASTKTAYSTGEDGKLSSSFIVGADGDEIGLYGDKGGVYVYKNKKFKATSTITKGEKIWAVFSGSEDVTDLVDVGDDIYCYYPYSASELEVIGETKASTWDGMRGMVISTEQRMKSGTENSPSYEHVGTYFPLVGKPTVVEGDEDHKVIELSFSNPFALARLAVRNRTSSELTITGFEWSIPGTPMTGSFSVNLKAPNDVPQPGETTYDKVSVTFTDQPVVPVGDAVCGVAIVAPCTQNKIALTVHTDKGDYVREVPNPSTITEYTYDAVNYYTVTIQDSHFVQTGDWKKVTDNSELTSGKYVLAYANGTTYKLFSFEKTMTNAQTAFEMVANMHSFEEVLPMRTELFHTAIRGNYQTVTAPLANADLLDIPEEIANEVAMVATTVEGETSNGSVVLKSTSVGNLDITKAYVKLEDDKSVTIASQVDAVDIDNILTQLRGHQISVTFANLVDFAGKKVGMSQNSISNALTAFDKLCVVAKAVLEEHDFGTLMDIDRNTRVLDVFARYYDNVAPLSYAYNSEVAFGWIKPIGFYAANDGFSVHVPVPSSIWFSRLDESLSYGEGGKAGFVAYWKKFDQDYPQYAQFIDRTTLFGRLAEKLVEGNYISDELFAEVASINWTSLGQTYERYANSLNGDPLEKVYLYKYVGE